MAIDQNVVRSSSDSSRASAIENELTAYRAISAQAVFSLLFGVASILCVANSLFFIAAILAVILGALADRKIQRFPDLLTGKGYAQAGIGLGLVFGLGSLTYNYVQDYIRTASATKFAKDYVEILKYKPVEDLLWLKMPPEARKTKSAAKMMEEMRKEAKNNQALSVYTGIFDQVKTRLASSKDEDVHFSKIELTGEQGLEAFATALIEFHGPGDKKEFPAQQYGLLVIQGKSVKGKIGWYVQRFDFPYTPSTFKPEPKKAAGDGHGHAH